MVMKGKSFDKERKLFGQASREGGQGRPKKNNPRREKHVRAEVAKLSRCGARLQDVLDVDLDE